MTRRQYLLARWQRDRTLAPAWAVGLVATLLMVNPAALLPLARAYRSLCEQYPPLALLTFHAPPLPLVLLLILGGIALIAGIWAGLTGLIRTHRFNRRVRRNALFLPPRLARVGADLGIADRLIYLGWTAPAAWCYGFIRPRIALTAGLLEQLDDEELVAVLAHERQHLSHRDPLRYLLLHTLSAAAFMFPMTPALRQRQEARIELAADRAALLVAPRGALAGALLAVLDVSPVPAPGTAWLTATEARIAQLSGRALMPEVPTRLVVASVGLAITIALTTIDLAASAHLVEMVCALCTGRAS